MAAAATATAAAAAGGSGTIGGADGNGSNRGGVVLVVGSVAVATTAWAEARLGGAGREVRGYNGIGRRGLERGRGRLSDQGLLSIFFFFFFLLVFVVAMSPAGRQQGTPVVSACRWLAGVRQRTTVSTYCEYWTSTRKFAVKPKQHA